MKLSLCILGTLFSFNVYAVQLECSGKYVWPRGQGEDKVSFAANIVNSETLGNVKEARQDVGSASATPYEYQLLRGDTAYNPRNPNYKNMNRYYLSSSGWTDVWLLLPKTLGQKASFKGYVQRVGHDSYPPIRLKCALK